MDRVDVVDICGPIRRGDVHRVYSVHFVHWQPVLPGFEHRQGSIDDFLDGPKAADAFVAAR